MNEIVNFIKENYVTISIVFVITILQLRTFYQTKKRRTYFENIFPEDAEKEYLIQKKDGVQIVSKELYNIEVTINDILRSIEVVDNDIQQVEHQIETYQNLQQTTPGISYIIQITEAKNELRVYKKTKQNLTKEIEKLNSRRKQLEDITATLQNGTKTEIINSINRYLKSNKNSVTDFNLIRDIIDRNCDVVEEEIQTQIPTPIYYGLMGTLLGIIFGAGALVFSGSLENLLTPFSSAFEYGSSQYSEAYTMHNDIATQGVLSLFGGVALATVSSIIGIILNVISTSKSKDTKLKVESKKHAFISWLQAELLPKISSDFSSALIQLGHDLTGFNNSFSTNAELLKKTILEVGNATSAQANLIQAIERIDITKIATANIEVYNQLKNCTAEIANLATDLKEIQNSIRGLGNYMNDGINEYQKRETYIKDASGKVDLAISDGQEKLSEATDTIFKQYNELLNTLYLQTENTTKELAKKYNDQAERLHTAIVEKLTDVKSIEEELKNLVAVKSSMTNLEKATVAQNKKIDLLTDAIRQLAQIKVTGGATQVEMKMPTLYKVIIIATGTILSTTGLFLIILKLLSILGIA